jgi:hypothetical protein
MSLATDSFCWQVLMLILTKILFLFSQISAIIEAEDGKKKGDDGDGGD